jgi:xanthine dehydrogenase iron-sulfur cluster and FAD-binding subunit A
VKPIDDIRSTAEYRKQVAANLLEDFLNESSSRIVRMNPILKRME